MLYVIPFIVLLVVLILLKLREGSKKGTDKSKKTTSKKAHAKTIKRDSSRNSDDNEQSDAPLVNDEISQTNSTSTVDDKFKQSIEKLIKARTFYTAEAKINQALNQDSSKHELYLYLVDIHLAQNDEFAIKQLLNYVRSLGLDHIAEQAEEKQRNYVPEEVIEEPEKEVQELAESTPSELNHSNANHGTKAFDALIIDTSDDSFDELHSDLKSQPEESNDLKVFEFYSTPAVVSTPAPQEASPQPTANIQEELFVEKIESFDFDDLKTFSEDSTESTPSELPTSQEEPLSFSNQSLDFNLSKPAQIEVETPEINLEDDFTFEEKAIVEATPLGSETSINLDVDIPNLANESKAENSHHLDFNLDSPEFNFKVDESQPSESLSKDSSSNELEFNSLDDQIEGETPSAESASSALDFESSLDFTLDQSNVAATTHETSTAQVVVDTVKADKDLDFAFETPATAYTTDAPQELISDVTSQVEPEALSIEPSALTFTSSTLLDVTSTTPSGQDESALNLAPANDSQNLAPAQTHDTEAQAEVGNDPLALAFPHLNEVNEAALDLQLAERYIALGAFEAAKVLLSRNAAQYTSEQRELSENLLNKIAS